MCWNWAIHKTYRVKGGKKQSEVWFIWYLIKKKRCKLYKLKITQGRHRKLVTEVALREGKDTRGEIFFFGKKMKPNTHTNKFTYHKCTAQFSQTEYIWVTCT